jgi:2-polyprenyl-3-methyl-5-hydroxy-6-metoxy-1,4-benzoquinol methylase
VTGIDLSRREPDLLELMDDPDCDLDRLRQTYARFGPVNRVLAGWRRIYRRQIRPLLTPHHGGTLLDVGCGGGDVARSLLRWSHADGLALEVTAVDPDERALAYAREQPPVRGLTLRRTTSSDLVAEGALFDVVVSNHVLHHLDPTQLHRLLCDTDRLARQLVVHNDIARSRLAYVAYGLASRPVAGRSFLRVDGMRSIRRSYRAEELAERVGEEWRVDRQAPARLLLLRQHPTGGVPGAPDGACVSRPSGTIEP